MGAGYVRQKIREYSVREEFDDILRSRRDDIRKKRTVAESGTEGLLDYFKRTTPDDWDRPEHLAPYAGLLEASCKQVTNDNATHWTIPVGVSPKALAEGIQVHGVPELFRGGVYAVVAAPPQHGKTELTLRAFLWWATRCPGKRHAYITYNEDRSEAVAREFQRLAELAGLEPQGTLAEVILKGGTKVKFTSVNGSLTGFPIDGVCVIDDPIKGPVEARSPKVRKRVVDFFDSVAWTRRHPGTSFIVMATRWHTEDLSGVLVRQGWYYLNLKCIAEGPANDNGEVIGDPLRRKLGESLWHRKPPEFFERERKNAYWWSALYQGEPRPQTGTVFRAPVSFYERLPSTKKGAFGLDLAYTAKTSADWSVCVEGIWHDGSEGLAEGLYIIDVMRRQVDAPAFTLALKTKKVKRPGWKMRWYAAGTEKGSGDFIKKALGPGVLKVRDPIGDKFVRATDVAAGWNSSKTDSDGVEHFTSKIHLPDPEAFPDLDLSWLPDFLDVIQNFTGIEDTNDDDVDALAALWDELVAAALVPLPGRITSVDRD